VVKVDDNEQVQKLSLEDLRTQLDLKGPYDDIFKNKEGKISFGNILLHMEYLWRSCKFLIGNGEFIYLIYYTTIAYMGYFYSFLYYGFHLFDIIVSFLLLS